MITWRTVESTNVVQVGWPSADLILCGEQVSDGIAHGHYEPKLLLVRFKNGKCYGYLGVSKQRAIYMATRCTSVGKYVNDTIKPNYQAVHIPELDVNGPPF